MDRSDWLALFREINVNMVSNDVKYANLSMAHNAAMGAALAFFFSNNVYEKTYGFLVPFLMSISSYIVFVTLGGIQSWKDQYYDVMKEILNNAGFNRSKKYMPGWLLDHKISIIFRLGPISIGVSILSCIVSAAVCLHMVVSNNSIDIFVIVGVGMIYGAMIGFLVARKWEAALRRRRLT